MISQMQSQSAKPLQVTLNRVPKSQKMAIMLPCSSNLDAYNILKDRLTANHFSVLSFKNNISHHTTNTNSILIKEAHRCLHWISDSDMDINETWICGTGNNAYATISVVMRAPDIDGFFLLSPEINTKNINTLTPCPHGSIISLNTDSELITANSLSIHNILGKAQTAQIDLHNEIHIHELKDIIDHKLQTTMPIALKSDRLLKKWINHHASLVE